MLDQPQTVEQFLENLATSSSYEITKIDRKIIQLKSRRRQLMESRKKIHQAP